MSAGETQPAGRALLIHRGMVSWMETCSVCLEAVKRSERPASKAITELAQSLPKQVETEVVRVMAEMAWAVSKEVSP